MPWNGSGVFNRVYNWTADANANIDILPDRMDTDTNDIATGLEHCLTVNGETLPVANIPLNNYKITGAGQGTNPGDYVTVGQVNGGGGGVVGGGFLPIAGGSLTGPLSVAGAVTSTGSNAGFAFNARDGSANFLWYCTGNVARLYSGADRFTVDNSGNGTFNGALYVANLITANGGITYGGTEGHTIAFGWNNTDLIAHVDGTGNPGALATKTFVTGQGYITGAALTCYATQSWVQSQGYVTGSYLPTSGGTINGSLQVNGNINSTNTISGSAINASSSMLTPSLAVGSSSPYAGSISCGNIYQANNTFFNGTTTGGTLFQMLGCGNNNHVVLGNYSLPLELVGNPGYFEQNWQANVDAAYASGASNAAWGAVYSYAYNPPSDLRLKTDIEDLPEDCLALVKRIVPKRYHLAVGPEEKRAPVNWGFIAQNIGEVMREIEPKFGGHIIGDDERHTECYDIPQMLACLWRAVAQLAAERS